VNRLSGFCLPINLLLGAPERLPEDPDVATPLDLAEAPPSFHVGKRPRAVPAHLPRGTARRFRPRALLGRGEQKTLKNLPAHLSQNTLDLRSSLGNQRKNLIALESKGHSTLTKSKIFHCGSKYSRTLRYTALAYTSAPELLKCPS